MTSTTVAIAGNPNVGKTSLFNALTGSRQKVGNYPGVTVERVSGTFTGEVLKGALLLDIPGTFSLNAQAADEEIAYNVLAGKYQDEPQPEAVIIVVNAANLPRNLYFASQILDFRLPTVIALNMMDLAEAQGKAIDVPGLEKALGVPVAPVIASKGEGIAELERRLKDALASKGPPPSRQWRLSEQAEPLLRELCDQLAVQGYDPDTVEGEALWLLSSFKLDENLDTLSPEIHHAVSETWEAMSDALPGISPQEHIIESRYAWIWPLAEGVTKRDGEELPPSLTERADRILLHPVGGLLIFFAIMFVVFQALFAWADPFIGLVEGALAFASAGVESALPAGIFTDLIVNGLIAGVGNTLVFLPQILIMFLFLGLLEETGYMARVAVLMEGLMRRVGLHGKSFIPLISGFACAIPGVMATRSIERREDRLVTMLVLPLVSCAARIPVYVLIIGVLFSAYPPVFGVLSVGGLVMMGMFMLSIVAVLGTAFVLKRTLVPSPPPAMIIELPPYQSPRPSAIGRLLLDRAWVFVSEAGTVILALTVVLWALFTFPRVDVSAMNEGDAVSAQVRQSYAGMFGHAIEPILKPLGMDWKMGIAVTASFAAREVFVSSLGVVYGISEADEESASLRQAMINERKDNGAPLYTPLTGLSVLVFFVLACQCMSTLAVIYRETKTWKWPVFVFGYMTVMAYVSSLVVYQGGRLLGFE